MQRRILIGCYEVPGYGGASTMAYRLFQMMQNKGYEVIFLNLINELDYEYFQFTFGQNVGNPKNLLNVHNYIIKGKLFKEHKELSNLINSLAVDTIIGIGYIATNLLKTACSSKKLIYLTTGCVQIKHYLNKYKNMDSIAFETKIDNAELKPIIYNKEERKAVKLSDLVVTHSPLILKYYNFFFSEFSGKIYQDVIWLVDYIYNDAMEYSNYSKVFSDREIDVLFVSSLWDRKEKNFQLVEDIVNECSELNIHIIGECSKKLPGARHHGLVGSRNELFEIMGNSKTFISTSKFDPAPGVLFEASALGCNIIASKNSGNWMICDEELIVNQNKSSLIIDKIYKSLKFKFKDNMNYFFEQKSFQKFLEILEFI